MKLGIVGHEAAKFTPASEREARQKIRSLFLQYEPEMVISGACPLGGIDEWAIEEAQRRGIRFMEYAPRQHSWEGEYGFKARNLDIANNSDLVVCIVVDSLPATYSGRRFGFCYHCSTDKHIKSGGCWTAKRAKKAEWIVVHNYG